MERTPIHSLGPGDIFHAVYQNDAPQICIVIGIEGQLIRAWDIARCAECHFDRARGSSVDDPGAARGVIVCVAPLPADTHEALVRMYERYRFGYGDKRFKLKPDEIRSLISLREFVTENKMTGTGSE